MLKSKTETTVLINRTLKTFAAPAQFICFPVRLLTRVSKDPKIWLQHQKIYVISFTEYTSGSTKPTHCPTDFMKPYLKATFKRSTSQH